MFVTVLRLRHLPALAVALLLLARAQASAQALPEIGPLITPWEVRSIWRGGLPDSRGDGSAITALGLNVHLRGGHTWTWRGFGLRLAPELTASENRAFDLPTPRDPTRDPYASPFYAGSTSIDLPERFGAGGSVQLHPGESALWWSRGDLTVTATTAQPHWGPPEGEGLVLGRSAPGVPRIELRHAWRAGGGRLAARWFTGEVHESAHFDADRTNDARALSGARIGYSRTSVDRVVRVGVARTVMDGRSARTVGRNALLPLAPTASDSIIDFLSLDLTLAELRSGTQAWLEVARQAPLRGLGDFAREPTRGIAFRLGLQQRLSVSPRAIWSVTAEAVRLDQSPLPDLYTSEGVPQGWTHRGQLLGSGLGPGGQRLYGRLDRAGPVWRLGAYAERVRWNDDALYREPDAREDRHDATLQAGLMAGRAFRGMQVTGHLSAGIRLNYRFEGASVSPDGRATDVPVIQLGLRIVPRSPPGR